MTFPITLQNMVKLCILKVTYKKLYYFKKNTNVTSIYNEAIEGGALYLPSLVSYLQELLLLNFALLGVGAISSLDNSNIWFTGGSTIYFKTT